MTDGASMGDHQLVKITVPNRDVEWDRCGQPIIRGRRLPGPCEGLAHIRTTGMLELTIRVEGAPLTSNP